MLTDLKDKILYKYRSPADDVVADFIIPCLKESNRYYRSVGFFRGASLRLFLDGLLDFLKKDSSKIKILTSVYLTDEDIEEIKKGVKNQQQIIDSELSKEIERLANSDDKVVLATLSWLISKEKLDIRIGDMKLASHAIFHDKLGIFLDEEDNKVVFYGSQNETVAAYLDNYDAIRVATSWGDNENKIKTELDDFNKLWEGRDSTVQTFTLPEAIENQILRYAPKSDDELFELIKEFQRRKKAETEGPKKKFNPRGLTPWSFQKRCIEAVKSSNFKGILKMATGTGKTVTTLFCLEQYFNTIKKTGNRIVIIVPSLDLAKQWQLFLNENKGVNDLVYAFNSKSESQSKSDLYYLWLSENTQNVILVITVQSLDLFAPLKKRVDFLIGDEVHAYGTENYMQSIENIYKPKYLLGLSATPSRYYDDIGTIKLMNYFGKVIFNFDISQAQIEPKLLGKETVLCNYLYNLSFVDLTVDEQKNLDKLNRKIGFEFSSKQEIASYEGVGGSKLQRLINLRSKIFKSAMGKIGALEQILTNYDGRLKNCIIYCEDSSQLNQVNELLQRLGITSYVNFHSMLDTRDEALAIFKEKQVKYIVSMHCLDQGVDIPDCSSLILMSSSGNPREYIQRRGRVLRNVPNKGLVRIFDIMSLPEEKDKRYKNSVMSQFLRTWEFVSKSLSPEVKNDLNPYMKQFDISSIELDDEIKQW